ncbi:hypothetical protein [Paenibacillus sp. PL91]|uniref:hypothetical protein n=1 Tax=Paenibacillus sp. PL91 TaxID=2729538 RepID=UPI00145E4E72|nr:hypothetical protein [Paenibacillus sp. PL91]MBC9204158.1 hypothetical protein [Paenibacillus sp. PL91]
MSTREVELQPVEKQNKSLKKGMRIRTVIGVFMMGIMIGTLPSIVHAAKVVSPGKIYGPVMGYHYYNGGELFNDSAPIITGKGIVGNASINVPTGYMGVKVKTYRNGVMCAMRDWEYSAQEQAGMERSVSGK